jgi:predicted transcriptional regulator
MGDQRDEDGRFRETYSEEAFLSALSEVEVASTQNVADYVGCSYDLAYRRLKQMEDDGLVRHEDVGNSFVWLVS